MIRIFASVILAALVPLAWPSPASAAEGYDNCTGFIDSLPAIIASQGVWCLRKDLSTGMSSGNAIEIATNNVTLDCNDFKIGGLGAGVATLATGVGAISRANTTIRRCNIRGFHTGVALLGGSGHQVEDNRLEGNTAVGIEIVGTGSEIRGNQVLDTGGSSVSGYAHGIKVGDEELGGVNGVDVIDNIVSGVSFADADGDGIGSHSNRDGSIVRNRISGVASTAKGTSTGIRNTDAAGSAIVGNHVLGIRGSGNFGIFCSTEEASAHANVVQVLGSSQAIESCFATSNTIGD